MPTNGFEVGGWSTFNDRGCFRGSCSLNVSEFWALCGAFMMCGSRLPRMLPAFGCFPPAECDSDQAEIPSGGLEWMETACRWHTRFRGGRPQSRHRASRESAGRAVRSKPGRPPLKIVVVVASFRPSRRILRRKGLDRRACELPNARVEASGSVGAPAQECPVRYLDEPYPGARFRIRWAWAVNQHHMAENPCLGMTVEEELLSPRQAPKRRPHRGADDP
jgi:hypothetical protein